MNFSLTRPDRTHPVRGFMHTSLLLLATLLAACGGNADPPQPAVSPGAQAPLVTTNPVDQTVQAGQTATFTVVASGTAPLSYQWQRGGAALAGATGASYTTAATVASDSGATFAVVVTNSVGSVTSTNAILTVTVPVTLTITQQPVSTTVAAGAQATFTADATCSGGTVSWQWQRSGDGGATWVDVTGAVATSYTLTTASSDNAAQFRVRASCSGQTQNTTAATLTVTTPATGPTLAELAVGLAPPAQLSRPAGVALDSTGVAYIVDSFRHTIRRIAIDGTVTTLAGQSGTPGSSDGTGSAASFNRPRDIAVGVDGTLYVTDTLNHTIRRITSAGVVTTLAGTAGSSGSTDGSGAAARFNEPFGITFGSDGALYVADSRNFTIRRITLGGAVTTLAGTAGSSGTTDGNATTARFGWPAGLVGDSSGALYVADQENNTVRKVTLGGATTTVAGNGSTTAADGVGTAAGLPRPGGLALAGGALYVTTFAGASANSSNLGQVRKVNLADSVVTTLAGVATQAASPTNETQIDGTPAQSVFQFGVYVPAGNDTVNRSSLAVASDGTLYVTDSYNDALRVIDPLGVTTTIVYGNIATPNGDGVVINRAMFGGLSAEMAIAVDVSGNVVVSDSSDHDIRRVTAAGSVSTIAGLHNRAGQVDAKGTAAMFARPDGIAAAPDGTLFVADTNNSAIRRIAPDGTVTTFAGTLGATGSADGLGTAAQFYQPRGIVRDSSGSLYVADSAGTTIRRIDIAGNVTTIAGTPLSTGSVDGVGPAARFSAIYGLAIDAAGVFYAADAGNNAIRKFTAGGVVSTVVGASGTTAQQGLANPHGVAVGADGTIYVADTDNNAVRAVSPAGVITTLIGASSDNFTRVGADPRIGTPTGIAVLGPKSLAVTGDRVYGAAVLTSVFVLTLP